MKMFANLHMHTTHSDGVYSPSEIVRVAKAEGYKAVAKADHDTATGYDELAEACRREGLESLFAVEFTAWYMYPERKGCHIVAFEFDPEYAPMKEYLEKMSANQAYNTRMCFEEGLETGNISGITWQEVLDAHPGITWLCNNHVFAAMKAKDLVKQEDYMAWYMKNFSKQSYKYPGKYKVNELKDMVKLIKDAGGIAVMAHPFEYLDDIDYYIECGIEGIEVWHPDLSAELKERAYKLALEKNLYISGGCDHSGLCGGLYGSYPTEEELKKSSHYIEPLSVGTTEHYFREIKGRRLMR